MRFEGFSDFWEEYVLFGAFTFANAIMDRVDEIAGQYTALLVCVMLTPVIVTLLFAGLMLTAGLIVVLVLLFPILLPVSIYCHYKNS